MPKGFQPKESVEGMLPNRLKRRNQIKEDREEGKRAEHMPTYLRKSSNLSATPLWSKILLGGIFFAYCGGVEILDAISSYSRGDSLRLILVSAAVIFGVTIYCVWSWWFAKKRAALDTGVARDRGESPVEMIHGKWRLKRKGAVKALPAQKTSGQSKERKPSKKYGMSDQPAPAPSPIELAQLGVWRETVIPQARPDHAIS
ncbi:hypothetical protein Slin15195_G126080 [Septoria linicola]|uniref:Uncharacterized protein n=1 Tax=Septoria linicola TaxID=215465 RepID=A0A9Q9B1L0_9PEZI|nr:hypothetical protein Slin14017_G082260 [Septoria linicola]USW59289.1 hypothetical protein Slin15195_G126080 [Septoria linicola]